MNDLPLHMRPVLGVIPARYGSTRFPGKALADIGGRTMLEHVYERSARSRLLDGLLVATDDERIRACVEGFGGSVVMTSESCPTGTDRARDAVAEKDCRTVALIQGDEPRIDPHVIDAAIRALAGAPECVCATPITRTRDRGHIESVNTAKVAVNSRLEALYFSRLPIPYQRTTAGQTFHYKHVGLYVYRRDFLDSFPGLAQTPLELAESLEQLRILESGFRIQCCEVEYEAVSVDTPEDLADFKRRFGF